MHIFLPLGLYSFQHRGTLIGMDTPNYTAGKARFNLIVLWSAEVQC